MLLHSHKLCIKMFLIWLPLQRYHNILSAKLKFKMYNAYSKNIKLKGFVIKQAS